MSVPGELRATRALLGWTRQGIALVAELSYSNRAGRRRPHGKHEQLQGGLRADSADPFLHRFGNEFRTII
jgi:hypothetical protein